MILNLLPGLKEGHLAITFHVVVVEDHEFSINQKKCHGTFKGKTCFCHNSLNEHQLIQKD